MEINKVRFEKFKQRLSPFAQKVMDKLLLSSKKESASEHHSNTYSTYESRHRPSNKKVIVFNNIPINLPDAKISYKKVNNFTDTIYSKITENTSRISTAEELITPVAVGSDCWDLGPTSFSEEYNLLKAPKLSHEKFIYKNLEKKLSIDWNDFLDEDFCGNFDSIPTIPNVIGDGGINLIEDNHNDKIDKTNADNLYDKEANDRNLKDLQSVRQPVVREESNKSTRTKINKIKQVKKTKSEQSGFRKVKYTKAVKNWLNDVDNNVDEAVLPLHDNNGKKDDIDETKKKTDKKISKHVKKIVQSQLANRGGIMKFAKPKPDKTEDDRYVNKLPPTNDPKPPRPGEKTCNNNIEKPKKKIIDELKRTENIKVKEKKTRSKFVAPVLTPLPVKDVTFEVLALDTLAQGNTLFQSNNEDIITVLLYSNGFNQLNRQCGSSGEPAGLMFGVRDNYYYINDFTLFSQDSICRLVSNNSLVCFNGKEVLIFLMDRYDLSSCSYNIIDLKTGASLLHPDEPPDTFSKLQKLLGKTSQFSIASECSLQKCARYVGLLRECGGGLRGLLADAGMWALFSDVEMQALPIIAEMEHVGVCIDEEHLRQVDARLLARMGQVERQCHAAAGRSFQVTSALQVRNIVYGELRLHQRCAVPVRETGGKAKSTSEAMLRQLAGVHPLPALVLQYRRLHKARATFVAGILHHARGAVVRPTWEQNAAVTGRVACSNPNLQAIPKTFNLALDQDGESASDAGAGAGVADTLSLRGAYVARAGRVFLAADFRHAECRVLALAAGDAALSAALASPDLFAVLAAHWLGKSEAAVSAEERERTKRLVYACLYGAGARTLADILRTGEDRAHAVMDSFHKAFPCLRGFGAAVVSAARGERGLRTAAGRARRLPQLSSDNRAARAHAERQAVNFIVQGSAADLCKAAMVACGAALRRAGLAARPLLQIHDELVWELPPHQLPDAARLIKYSMEGCGARVGLPAPFPVRLSAGPSWGDLAPYPA